MSSLDMRSHEATALCNLQLESPSPRLLSIPVAGTKRCRFLAVVPSLQHALHYNCLFAAGAGLKVMVECRSNSRHMLTWLMDQMDADKDSIFLAVTKSHDQGTGMVSLTICMPGILCHSISHGGHTMAAIAYAYYARV